MNISELKLLKLFNERKIPTEDDIQLFKDYIPYFKYPVGVILSLMGYVRNADYLKDYMWDYNYFKSIIDSVYVDYYNENERVVISHFFSLYFFQVQDLEITYLSLLKQAFSIESNKTEIRQFQTEIKYKYALALIIHGIGVDTEVEELFSELENEERYERTFLAEKIKEQ